MFIHELNDGRIGVYRGRRMIRVFMTMFAAITFIGNANAQEPKAKRAPSVFTQCRDAWADKKPTAEKFGYFHHMSDCLKVKGNG